MIADYACREATDLPLDLISGDNSANLPLLASGAMPEEINHLRIGEAITLVRYVLEDGLIPEDAGVIVLGGSSDHLVLDVEEAHAQGGRRLGRAGALGPWIRAAPHAGLG